jgi:hypothetical protein
MNPIDAPLHPAFASTPVAGVRLAVFRGVSQSAEKIFQVAAALLSRPGS